MDRLTEQVIRDILIKEMGFKDNDIWITDENRKIPNDKGFYAVVGLDDSHPYSSKSELITRNNDNGLPELVEVTTVNARDVIRIDVFGRGTDAVRRRWEVVGALSSIFAKQQQEKYRFKIGKIPNSLVDASGAEGGSNIHRYYLSFACLVWYRKERVIDPNGGEYYDNFDTRIDDEETIGKPEGLIEFNIKAEE